MKKGLLLILIIMLLASAFAGCIRSEHKDEGSADDPEVNVYKDGRARPSCCGRLQVKGGKLCSQNGDPVMLRGVSTNDMMVSESFLNDALIGELSKDNGVNVIRLAVYTYGVGIIGYCTAGDRERYDKGLEKGIELAAKHDMYAIIDWHILGDGDPNTYADDAEAFFSRMAEKYKESDNVIYEICNEPNGVSWADVKRYAERIIPAIRANDPKAVIIVGSPDWSKDLLSAADDPLEFDNIMYSLHFYSATHGKEVRDMAAAAVNSGLPVFVTEFGVTASSGDLPRDIESADKWIELLEEEHISYCMWSLSKAPEASSMIRSFVPKYSGFETNEYSESGQWLLETIKKHDSM